MTNERTERPTTPATEPGGTLKFVAPAQLAPDIPWGDHAAMRERVQGLRERLEEGESLDPLFALRLALCDGSWYRLAEVKEAVREAIGLAQSRGVWEATGWRTPPPGLDVETAAWLVGGFLLLTGVLHRAEIEREVEIVEGEDPAIRLVRPLSSAHAEVMYWSVRRAADTLRRLAEDMEQAILGRAPGRADARPEVAEGDDEGADAEP